MADSILTRKPEFYQIWDWWWNINNNISSHFRLLPRKTNDKTYEKNLFWAHFEPFFAQIWANMKFLGKKISASFKIFQVSTTLAKSQKKLMSHSWEKCRTDGRTDGQTDNGDFIGPSVGPGSKIQCYSLHTFLGTLSKFCKLAFTGIP